MILRENDGDREVAVKSLTTIFKLRAADRFLMTEFKKRSKDDAFAESAKTIEEFSEKRLEEFGKALQDLEQTETKRCEVIDTKSHIIIAASATALALLCKLAEPTAAEAVAATSANKISIATITLQILIMITGISWVASAICAFRVTKVTGLHQLTSADLQNWLSTEYCLKKMTAAKRLNGIQANEFKLMMKINYLSTAQDFFVEGLVSLLAVLVVMMVSPWIHCPQWHDGLVNLFLLGLVLTTIIASEVITIILIYLALRIFFRARRTILTRF